VEFNTVLFVFEPLSYLGTFVILGVVQDHVYLSTPVHGDELVQEGQEAIGVEPVDEAEVKFGMCTITNRTAKAVIEKVRGFTLNTSSRIMGDLSPGC
jgi:hypothetical protein